jgi:PDZ domain-containing secreted protein
MNRLIVEKHKTGGSMLKYTKLMLIMLFIVSAAIIPIYAQQEPCDKCKANPESCKLLQTGKCDDCKTSEKTIEKKVIVLTQDQDRGFLGVVAEKTDKGLAIRQIVPSSPAEKSGLKVGDIFLEVEKKSVKTPDDLITALKGTKPKDEITIKIKSKDDEKLLKIILAEVPKTETKMTATVSSEDKSYETDKEMMMSDMKCSKCVAKGLMSPQCLTTTEQKCPMLSMEKGQMIGKCSECGMTDKNMEICQYCNKKMEPCMLGMPEMPMTKEIEKDFTVMPSKETRGFLGVVTAEEDGKLVIQSIVPNSPAEKVGLKEDDVILEVNGTAVSTPSDLIEVLKGTRPGDLAHFKIISGGIEKMVDIELGEVPTTQTPKMKIMIGGRKAEKGIGAGYFGPGYMSFDYSALNTIFTNRHLPSLDKNQFVFGGGGWGQGDRIRLGGFGLGGSQTVSNDTLSVEVGYGAGFFEMGYNIVNAKHFLLTPIIGIGGGGLTIKITSLSYNPANLDDVMNHPGGISTVTTGGITMFPGLSIDIPISFAGLSIKGGYMWTPMKGAWMVENFGKINGPGFDLKGPFVTLNVMFGGNGSHRHK